jgi:23S rRNA (cytidine1920-2'-O)/16S rRNA (cytidine1409-2'-O)-methyltransferase
MTIRLDEALVAQGLAQSRSRARDMVLRGGVTVNGAVAAKPSKSIFEGDVLAVIDEAQKYVSRAALKLIHGLDHFNIAATGRQCLDIGSSTGGFTQVLLERGAEHVTAIDVGHGQMAEILLNDPRITLIEGLNAREMNEDHMPDEVSLIVCDVSFISLRIALPAVLEMAPEDCVLLALIKPQFEVGRHNVGRGGMVTDPSEHTRVCDEITAFITSSGWVVQGVVASPLEGGDGNLEFLLAAQKSR